MIYPEYIQPHSLKDMWSKIPRNKKIYFLAGGTDLLCYLRDDFIDIEKSCFVDISLLKEICGIKQYKEYIKIGSRTTFRDISENPVLLKWCQPLNISAKTIGTPQIANRATIGGNIANASPSGDSLPALIALNARVEIANFRNKRLVNITGIFKGPKKTSLANGEIITSILIPKPKLKKGLAVKGGFKKIGGRRAHIISKISVAIYAGVKGKTIDFINVAMGAVGPTVISVPNVSKILKDKKITPELIKKCILEIQRVISPIDDFRSTADYRKEVTGPLFEQIMGEIIQG